MRRVLRANAGELMNVQSVEAVEVEIKQIAKAEYRDPLRDSEVRGGMIQTSQSLNPPAWH